MVVLHFARPNSAGKIRRRRNCRLQRSWFGKRLPGLGNNGFQLLVG
jgi:hypothetical protein